MIRTYRLYPRNNSQTTANSANNSTANSANNSTANSNNNSNNSIGANTMSFIRFQPWQEVETMQRQLNQLFDDIVPMTRETVINRLRVPAIELAATDSHLVLKAELPGFSPDDLDLEVTREAVTLKGEVKAPTPDEHHHIYRSEFRYGQFHRVIPLPVEVNHTETTAEFVNGILTIYLPKLVETKQQSVKVAIASSLTPQGSVTTPS
jgi:HSP20 family protein